MAEGRLSVGSTAVADVCKEVCGMALVSVHLPTGALIDHRPSGAGDCAATLCCCLVFVDGTVCLYDVAAGSLLLQDSSLAVSCVLAAPSPDPATERAASAGDHSGQPLLWFGLQKRGGVVSVVVTSATARRHNAGRAEDADQGDGGVDALWLDDDDPEALAAALPGAGFRFAVCYRMPDDNDVVTLLTRAGARFLVSHGTAGVTSVWDLTARPFGVSPSRVAAWANHQNDGPFHAMVSTGPAVWGGGREGSIMVVPVPFRAVHGSNATDEGRADASTPQLVSLNVHTATVWCLALCHGGHAVVSSGDDGVICVWDSWLQALLQKFRVPRGSPVCAMGLVRSGGRGFGATCDLEELWTATTDGTVCVWDASNAFELLEAMGHEGNGEGEPRMQPPLQRGPSLAAPDPNSGGGGVGGYLTSFASDGAGTVWGAGSLGYVVVWHATTRQAPSALRESIAVADTTPQQRRHETKTTGRARSVVSQAPSHCPASPEPGGDEDEEDDTIAFAARLAAAEAAATTATAEAAFFAQRATEVEAEALELRALLRAAEEANAANAAMRRPSPSLPASNAAVATAPATDATAARSNDPSNLGSKPLHEGVIGAVAGAKLSTGDVFAFGVGANETATTQLRLRAGRGTVVSPRGAASPHGSHIPAPDVTSLFGRDGGGHADAAAAAAAMSALRSVAEATSDRCASLEAALMAVRAHADQLETDCAVADERRAHEAARGAAALAAAAAVAVAAERSADDALAAVDALWGDRVAEAAAAEALRARRPRIRNSLAGSSLPIPTFAEIATQVGDAATVVQPEAIPKALLVAPQERMNVETQTLLADTPRGRSPGRRNRFEDDSEALSASTAWDKSGPAVPLPTAALLLAAMGGPDVAPSRPSALSLLAPASEAALAVATRSAAVFASQSAAAHTAFSIGVNSATRSSRSNSLAPNGDATTPNGMDLLPPQAEYQRRLVAHLLSPTPTRGSRRPVDENETTPHQRRRSTSQQAKTTPGAATMSAAARALSSAASQDISPRRRVVAVTLLVEENESLRLQLQLTDRLLRSARPRGDDATRSRSFASSSPSEAHDHSGTATHLPALTACFLAIRDVMGHEDSCEVLRAALADDSVADEALTMERLVAAVCAHYENRLGAVSLLETTQRPDAEGLV